MNAKANLQYNIRCLEQLGVELSKQIKRYPRQMAWIELELARLDFVSWIEIDWTKDREP